MSDILAPMSGLLAVIVPILVIYACIMGYRRKIVVYDSQADLNIACITLISLLLCGIAFGVGGSFLGLPLLVLSGFFLWHSARRAFMANRTAWNGVLAVFAKYAFLGLIVLCALIAIGGAFAALEDGKKKRYKEAAGNAALAAGGALGFVAVRRLINQLITEPSAKG